MILFMSYTPSQVFNAIVLASTVFVDKKCDIYFTKRYKIYFDKINRPECFNECFEIEVIQDSFTGYFSKTINKVWNALKFQKILENLPSDPHKYEEVFFSGSNYRAFEIYYAIKKLNPKIELNLYEEGINEYYYYNKKISYLKRIFAKAVWGRFYINDVKKVYIYNPCAVIYNKNLFELKKIPRFIGSSYIKNMINQTFSYQPTILREKVKQVVFLDQYFGDHADDDFMDRLQSNIITILINRFGCDNVWIKLHPRSKEKKYGIKYNYLMFNAPIEVMILNENIEQNIFVSICSSSILNFKLIFDMEPFIFSFNRMALKDADVNALFSYVKNSYKTPRFFMPMDLEEFQNKLDSI